MDLLLKKVKKELDNIAEKGLTSSNLETTYKLIDIYKDIKGICNLEEGTKVYEQELMTLDNSTERYFKKIKEGMAEYSEGKTEHEDGGVDSKMIEGIEATMSATLNFIESLVDHADTSEEKEIIKKYANKIKTV